MIRCLTGMLESVGAGRTTVDECAAILAAKDRSAAPETAPARGLFLMKVFFNEAELHQWQLEKLPFS
jgi:tRNA pseudouridine38-40 synthase